MKDCVSTVGPLVAMAFVVACVAMGPRDDGTAANKIVAAGNDAGSGINPSAAGAGPGQASGNGTDSSGTTLIRLRNARHRMELGLCLSD